ncbi:glycosyl hydrolase family 28-related protein [Gordonia sp. NPDC003376]
MPNITFTLATLPAPAAATALLRFKPRNAPWTVDGKIVTPDTFQRRYTRNETHTETLPEGAWQVRIGKTTWDFDVPAEGGDLAALIAFGIPAGTPTATLQSYVEAFGQQWLDTYSEATIDSRVAEVGDSRYAKSGAFAHSLAGVATAQPTGAVTVDTGQTADWRYGTTGVAPYTGSNAFWGTMGNSPTGSAAYLCSRDLGAPVAHAKIAWRFAAGTGGGNGCAVIAVTTAQNDLPVGAAVGTFGMAAHLVCTKAAWSFGVWVPGSGLVNIVSAEALSRTLETDDTTKHTMELWLSGSTATVLLPDGRVRKVTDSRIATYAGNFVFFESFGASTTDDVAKVTEVSAEPRGVPYPSVAQSVIAATTTDLSGIESDVSALAAKIPSATPSFVGVAHGTRALGTTITVTVPAGVQAGDLILASGHVAADSGTCTITGLPAGATSLATITNTAVVSRLSAATATGSESGTVVTFTFSTSGLMSAQVLVLRGVGATAATPTHVFATGVVFSAFSPAAGKLPLHIGHIVKSAAGASTLTPPSGITKIAGQTIGASDQNSAFAGWSATEGTAVGTTWTLSDTGWVGGLYRVDLSIKSALTQKWRASTAYAGGDLVCSPLGVFLARKSAGTSTSTWAADVGNWVAADRSRLFNALDFGADGEDAGDSTTAIQSAMTAAGVAGGTVKIPQGVYRVTATLTLPRTASLDMWGATLKATASIAGAVLEVGDETGWWRNRFIAGGRVECNNLANKGVLIRRAYASKLDHITVANAKQVWIQLGDPASAVSCHEAHLIACKGESDYAAPTGSVGLWATVKCADSVFTDCIMVGAETSFLTEGGRNTHIGSHGWGGWTDQLPYTIFKDAAPNSLYLGCYPDTPTHYGWWFTADSYRWQINGGFAYNHENGIDNQAVVIHTDVSNTNGAVIIGLTTVGATSSYRWASDYDGSLSSANIKIIGCQSYNTTTTNLPVDTFRSVNALRVRNTGANPTIANGAGVGTSPPAATITSTSRDMAGLIQLGTGTSPSVGTLCEVTYNVAVNPKPTVTLTPMSEAAVGLGLWVDYANSTTGKFVVKCSTAPAASLAASSIQIAYRVDVAG